MRSDRVLREYDTAKHEDPWAYCVPIDVVKENIENLNATKKTDSQYWHIALTLDDGELKWNLSKVGRKIDFIGAR